MPEDKQKYAINAWIPAIPVSTTVEAESHEEAQRIGQERLEAEHGEVDIDEVVEVVEKQPTVVGNTSQSWLQASERGWLRPR